jgi:hypothetical protein
MSSDIAKLYQDLMQNQKDVEESQGIFHKGLGHMYEGNAGDVTEQNIRNLETRPPNMSAYAAARNSPKIIAEAFELIKTEKILTLHDLEDYFYGGSFTKVLSTSSTDMINNLYGRRAWDQVNREHSLFSLLRKAVWTKSGWRLITPETANTAQYQTENGSIPNGEDPTFKKLMVTPSSIAVRNTRTDIADVIARIEDGVGIEEITQWLDARHKQIINLELLYPNEYAPLTYGIWSIDRLIASNAELAYGNIANSAVIAANYLDVYGLDRDAAPSYADAQVTGLAWGSGDRVLAVSHLDEILRLIRTNAGRANAVDQVFVTHPETADRIDELCRDNQRYNDILGTMFIRGGVNGLEAVQREGIEGGFQVATWKGVPIFEDICVPQDTVGRIYLINLQNMFVSMLMPTQFYGYGGPELTQTFNKEAMYRSVFNIVCTNFRSQGKIRDLKIS